MGFTRNVVQTDFFSLNETKSNISCPKRDTTLSQEEEEMSTKKAKLDLDDALSLSLTLPDIESSNNNNNTKTTCRSNLTGTAASLSHSKSRPLSYNAYSSVGRNINDQISGGRDHGSVHSRFRPIVNHGLVALNNNTGHAVTACGPMTLMQEALCNHAKDSYNNNSVLFKADSFDTLSFFQSALPWWPRLDGYSGDSRRTEGQDGEKRSTSRRILREIVSESIPLMSQIFQRIAQETLASTKDYLSNLIAIPPNHEERKELVGLQNRLERRSDLTKEALSKCQKDQLEILVAIKMGLGSFISGNVRLPTIELVEIFLFMRCRNVKCKSILPVDDCDCKLCSGSKGFCSLCTCQVCMNFDSASNNCTWVGCDVCSHWCHASCGIKKNLIKPGQQSGSQFHCIACNHASEMFGFVKDVFVCCAKDWGMETVIKELDCVSKIFQGSEDSRDRELHTKAEGLLSELERKLISASDACNIIIQFFNCVDDGMTSGFPASGVSAKELLPTEPTIYGIVPSNERRDSLVNQSDLKAACVDDLENESEFQFWNKDGLDGLENIVRIKEAEATMFQRKADDAWRVAQGYWQLMIEAMATDKLNKEEYAGKLAKLSLQETEEKLRKQLEERKIMESSHCDHHNMMS